VPRPGSFAPGPCVRGRLPRRPRSSRTGAILLGLLLGLAAGPATAAGTPAEEAATRAHKALLADAADLRKVARFGDENGLERTADVDWAISLGWDPEDEAVRKRLRWLRREGAWVRDDASWALLRAGHDAKPDRRPAYQARRTAEFVRPSAARHREEAAWCRAHGLPHEADAQLYVALERDPDDLWSHLALGEIPDPEEGWVPFDLRRRRVFDQQAAADVRRLVALRSDATREEADSMRSATVGAPLSTWRLREWRLETDLPDEDASLVLATVDLGARWFRERFGIDLGAPVLPGDGVFVVLSTAERYALALDGEAGLSKAERAFGKGLSALPVPHEATHGPWVVVLERPDGLSAADACLHYAIHFLFQARFHVEAQEAWLYEGLAAYATLRLMGTQGTWCVRLEETSATAVERAPSPDDWAEQVSGLVSKSADEPLRRLVGASLNELDGPMLVKAWSLLRFLLEEHGDEAVAVLEARRAGMSTEAAFATVTGLRLDDVDALWRRHVRAILGE